MEALAQNKNGGNGRSITIDSLKNLIIKSLPDTNKVNHFNNLAIEYRSLRGYDTAITYGKAAQQLAQQLNFKKGLADSYNAIGNVYYDEANYPEALKNYFASLKIKEKLDDKKGIADLYSSIGINYNYLGNYQEALKNHKLALNMRKEMKNTQNTVHSYNNIGSSYYNLGNYPKALENHFLALKLSETIEYKKGQANSHDYIGAVYYSLNNYPEALKNYFVALKLREDMQDKLSNSYSHLNIGIIYYNQGNYPEALKNTLSALKIVEEKGDKPSIAQLYNNIGVIYYDQGNYTEALKKHAAALQLFEKIGDKKGMAYSFVLLSKVYIKFKKYLEASDYLSNALKLSTEIGSKNYIKDSYENLAVLDSIQGNWKLAYQHHKLFIVYRDSIKSGEITKKATQVAMNYEFEKKELLTKAIYEKEIQIANYKKIAVVGLLIIVCLLAFILINRQRIKIKEQKRIYQTKQQLTQSELYRKELEANQLRSNLEVKQEKLNNYTNLIKEKTRIIDALEEQFETINNTNTTVPTAEQLLTIIKENRPPEEFWDEFITNFNLVNKNFFNQLTALVPDITRNEMNYCALIKCNLSNKEIANILNVSPDSAKRARNRLKKKMNLDADDSLAKYISSLN